MIPGSQADEHYQGRLSRVSGGDPGEQKNPGDSVESFPRERG